MAARVPILRVTSPLKHLNLTADPEGPRLPELRDSNWYICLRMMIIQLKKRNQTRKAMTSSFLAVKRYRMRMYPAQTVGLNRLDTMFINTTKPGDWIDACRERTSL